MNFGRWQSLMSRLGMAEHREVFESLRAAYAEAHRFYHTVEHISSCLELLDGAAGLTGSPEEVELALWFHDAVYDPRAQDNEEKSAQWASEFLARAGAAEDRRARVHGHIMATEHHAVPGDPDAALVVDIDLAILGSLPDAYQAFEANIRREYQWVPRPLYCRKRREVLNSFLARPRIYATDHFHDLRETAARRNLRAAIEALA